MKIRPIPFHEFDTSVVNGEYDVILTDGTKTTAYLKAHEWWVKDDAEIAFVMHWQVRKITMDQIKSNLPELEWEPSSDNSIKAHESFGGDYWIKEYPNHFVARHYPNNQNCDLKSPPLATLDQAKEAAQNHYAAKVAELFNLTTE